ncbi:mucin-binding protein [Lacticaseibacillus daqingensis]|uniref:mucin-binding protein n=1 Tax=Lacticaseibacillus daqingensis TaxID=2486014 RepID=UPI0013DE6C21|nr:KxYKxGKxW signal peptide domain-containing protein [Lacticaseibacillus daqingensis]
MKKQLRRRHDATMTAKLRLKLYKAGKRWVVAGMTTVAFAAGLSLTSGRFVQADEGTAPVAAETGGTDQDAGAATLATPAAGDPTAASSDTVSSAASAAATEPPASDGPTVPQPAADTETPVAAAVTLTSRMATPTVNVGATDVFALNFNVTGIKTSYTNATLVIQLSSGVRLQDDPGTLTLRGVTPVYDEAAGTLTYDFGALSSGLATQLALHLTPDKALVANGETITASAQFSADGLSPQTTQATATAVAAARAAVTNAILNIAAADPAVTHDNPAQGDTVTLGAGYTVSTADAGAGLVAEGTPITMTYTLAKGLTYGGMATVDGYLTDAPVVTTNAAGATVLTWTQPAGARAAQLAASATYKYAFLATVDADVALFTRLVNPAQLTAQMADGTTFTANAVNATVMISPANPTAPVTAVGGTWPLSSYGPANGEMTLNTGTGNADPTVYAERAPLLATTSVISTSYFGIGVSDAAYMAQTQGMIDYVAMHQRLSAGETLQRLVIGQAYYNPSVSEANPLFNEASFGRLTPTGYAPLTTYPYLTLAVKYAGETTYTVLETRLRTDQTYTLTRQALLAMGLDPAKTVVDVYAYYHLDADGQALPDNPDAVIQSTTPGPGQAPVSNFDVTQVPVDSGAPNGLMQTFSFITSVDPGFVGTITHQFLPQLASRYGIIGTPSETVMDQVNANNPTKLLGRTDATRLYLAEKTVEVVQAATDVTRTVASMLTLADGAGVMTVGAHQLAIQLTLADTSQANLGLPDAGATTYVFLPAGVQYDPATTRAADGAAVTVVATDYQGSGQQLLRIDWGKSAQPSNFLRPGEGKGLTLGIQVAANAASDLVFQSYTDLGPAPYTAPESADPDAAQANRLVADADDLNGNGQTTDSLLYATARMPLLKTSKLDTVGTPSETQVAPGATVVMAVGTRAETDAQLTQLELIAALPKPGDLGLTTSDPRGSDFSPTLTGPVVLPVDWQGKVTVAYTTSTVADLSAATWLDEAAAAADWGAVTAFRISYANAAEPIAGGAQTVQYTLQVPMLYADEADGGAARSMTSTFSVTSNGLATTEPQAVPVVLDRVLQGTVSVTRTITYTGADAQTPAAIEQVVTYDFVTNETTGTTVYTPTGAYAEVQSPVILGYTVDRASIAALTPTAVTFDQADDPSVLLSGIQELVTYTRQPNTIFTPTKPGEDTGTTVTDLTHVVTITVTYGEPVGGDPAVSTVTFYRTVTVDPTIAVGTAGHLTYSAWTTDPEGDAANGTATVAVPALADLKTPLGYTASVTTTLDGAAAGANDALTVDASNTAVVRQVTYERQPDTIYTPTKPGEETGTTRDDLVKGVAVTVNYGDPVNQSEDQSVTFYRTATVDPTIAVGAAGHLTYGTWTTDPAGDATKGTATATVAALADLKTPLGYTASVTTTLDGAAAGANDALTVTAANDTVIRTVSYAKQATETFTPDQPGEETGTQVTDLTHVVTVTVTYGELVGGDPAVSTVTFYRTVTVDPAIPVGEAGHLTYSPWTTGANGDAAAGTATATIEALADLRTPLGYVERVTSAVDGQATDDNLAIVVTAANATVTRAVNYTRQPNTVYTPTKPGEEAGTTVAELTHVVTITVNYGAPVGKTTTATQTFYRTATIDTTIPSGEVGHLVYGAWTTDPEGDATRGPATATVDALTDLRTPVGYTAVVASMLDGQAAAANAAITVSAANSTVARTVTYAQTPAPAPTEPSPAPSKHGQGDQSPTGKPALPQTGNQANGALALLGLALTSLLGGLTVLKRRRKA